MDVFTIMGKIALDNSNANKGIDETTGKANDLATAMGSAFSKAGNFAISCGKTIAKGLAVGATAMGALITGSVKQYAEYEQLVGGVDTLFGESSQKVQQYAAEAYKNQGLSANEYMSTVTSFSASLLQSLGGDTSAAADVANMALTDMADNANKMGTSMSSIQDAYQGFAKQNYTMLDNLKLGYGGTKTEMQRLLKDAQKISGVKYNIKNLDDVYEAIHVIQNEMGITGTTALEASETISGSFSATNAAWTNMLIGIASGSQDMDKLINNFATSAVTAIGNITKLLPNITSGVTQMINGLAPMLPGIIQALLPSVLEGAVALISGLASALPGIFQIVVEMLPTIMAQLATAFEQVFPMLLQAISGVLGQIDFKEVGAALGNMFTSFINNLPEIMSKVGNAIKTGWESYAWPFIQGLFEAAFGVTLPEWSTISASISEGWSTTVWPVIQDLFKAAFGVELPDWASITQAIEGGWEDGIWPMIQDLFKTNFAIELPDWEGTKAAISDLWTKVKNGISGYFSAIFTIFTPDEDGTSVAVELAAWWGKVLTALGTVISAVFSIFTEDDDGRSVGERLKVWWNKVTAALGTYISSVFAIFTPDEDGTSVADELKAWWLKVLGVLGNAISSVFGIELPDPQTIINNVKNWWSNQVKPFLGLSARASVSVSKTVSEARAEGATDEQINMGVADGSVVPDGTHATGLDFVPRDNYLARLHKGEAVLTSSEAEVWRNGGSDADTIKQVQALTASVNDLVNNLPDMLVNAFATMRFDVNNREFARLVKAVT